MLSQSYTSEQYLESGLQFSFILGAEEMKKHNLLSSFEGKQLFEMHKLVTPTMPFERNGKILEDRWKDIENSNGSKYFIGFIHNENEVFSLISGTIYRDHAFFISTATQIDYRKKGYLKAVCYNLVLHIDRNLNEIRKIHPCVSAGTIPKSVFDSIVEQSIEYVNTYSKTIFTEELGSCRKEEEKLHIQYEQYRAKISQEHISILIGEKVEEENKYQFSSEENESFNEENETETYEEVNKEQYLRGVYGKYMGTSIVGLNRNQTTMEVLNCIPLVPHDKIHVTNSFLRTASNYASVTPLINKGQSSINFIPVTIMNNQLVNYCQKKSEEFFLERENSFRAKHKKAQIVKEETFDLSK